MRPVRLARSRGVPAGVRGCPGLVDRGEWSGWTASQMRAAVEYLQKPGAAVTESGAARRQQPRTRRTLSAAACGRRGCAYGMCVRIGDRRDNVPGGIQGSRITMSKSGILDTLKDEEKSLRTQLVAIQRAIEAIEGADAPGPAGRGKKKALKVVAKRKRTMTEEQRQAVAERMRNYWASRREAKAQE